MAQLGSALDWGSRGRRFKSCRPDQLSCRSEAVLSLTGGRPFAFLEGWWSTGWSGAGFLETTVRGTPAVDGGQVAQIVNGHLGTSASSGPQNHTRRGGPHDPAGAVWAAGRRAGRRCRGVRCCENGDAPVGGECRTFAAPAHNPPRGGRLPRGGGQRGHPAARPADRNRGRREECRAAPDFTALDEAATPVLAFRLDRLEPFGSTHELGQRVGPPMSPVGALGAVADGRPCVSSL